MLPFALVLLATATSLAPPPAADATTVAGHVGHQAHRAAEVAGDARHRSRPGRRGLEGVLDPGRNGPSGDWLVGFPGAKPGGGSVLAFVPEEMISLSAPKGARFAEGPVDWKVLLQRH
jgi:hypothetical protein